MNDTNTPPGIHPKGQTTLPGIHPKGQTTLPAIIIYDEPVIRASFYSPTRSTLISIATEFLEVDSVEFSSMIFSLDSNIYAVIIDAPTYRKHMQSKD